MTVEICFLLGKTIILLLLDRVSVKISRKDETFACKTFRLLELNAVFWQRPTSIAKFQSLPRQISQFRGHFENRLEKNLKNRIASNKCDICTLEIMIDFH